jgi:hypothetical protein
MEPGLDIGEHDVNIGARFEYGDRLVGVRGLDNLETGFTDHFRGVHPQQEFVFDDQNHGSACLGSSHYTQSHQL